MCTETLAALKRMKARDRGSIVQVGSALAYRGIPLQSAYCAAKHAVQGFHDSLRSNRREINVGWPAVKAIWGNNIAPAYADHYLARNGYDAQMIDEPEDPDRPDNLWEPLPGDAGAHGVFDDRAQPFDS